MKPLAPLKRGPKILRAWLNHLRAHVTANRILRGENYEVREHPGGAQLDIRFPSADLPPNGSTPYILGSTVHGSDTAGPGGTDGPWGGSGDLSGLGDGSTAFTDTWHRDRMPLTPADVQTDCVDSIDGWRYHALTPAEGIWVFTDDGATARGWYATRYQTFFRTRRYDRRGLLSISAESAGPIVTDATFDAS